MTNYEKFVEVFGRSPLLRDRDVESEIWLESEYKKPEQEEADSN